MTDGPAGATSKIKLDSKMHDTTLADLQQHISQQSVCPGNLSQMNSVQERQSQSKRKPARENETIDQPCL